MSAKISQHLFELESHLEDHLGFLRSSADAYDLGHDGEAKRLAVSLRVPLHDTASSHSLLGQLARLDASFLSTALPHDAGNIGTHGGLVMVAAAGTATKYVAMLDDVPFQRWLPFKEWWNETVFMDDRRAFLSRRQLILAVANQDGGAHVDPSLGEVFARLSRHNSLGWTMSDGKSQLAIPKVERAAVRQIAHEILRTLVPTYRMKPAHQAEMIFGGGMIHEGSSVPPLPSTTKHERNDPCPCGSERKWKQCHRAHERPG